MIDQEVFVLNNNNKTNETLHKMLHSAFHYKNCIIIIHTAEKKINIKLQRKTSLSRHKRYVEIFIYNMHKWSLAN